MSAARRSISQYQDPNGGTVTPRTPRSMRRTGTPEDGDLIVARGLQEILDKELRKPRPEDAAETRGSQGKKRKSTSRAPGTAPAFVFCYLCGRQFGKASIEFHRPQCYLKKMIEWERTKPELRGPKPIDPATHDKMVQQKVAEIQVVGGSGTTRNGGGGMTKGKRRAGATDPTELYNQIQFDQFNTNALKACPNCGRTFLPDRLEVHLRSCKPGSSAKPVSRAAPAKATVAAPGAGRPAKSVSHPPPQLWAGDFEKAPIRTSGGYSVPADLGIDAVPPGTSDKSPSATRPSQPLADSAAADADNVPIKASGTYAVPNPSADHNNVPPAVTATRRRSSGVASHATSSLTSVPLLQRKVSVQSPPASDARRVANSDNDSSSAFAGDDDAEPRRASERRLSASVQREALAESSTPHRPADMKPTSYISADDASAALSLDQVSSSSPSLFQPANGDVAEPLVTAPNLQLQQRRKPSTRSSMTAVEAPPAAHEESTGLSQVSGSGFGTDSFGGGDGAQPRNKIPLNNVSRFKNVPSRLKMEMHNTETTLTPCCYCGRKFTPERVEKHQSVCIERNKPPGAKPRNIPSATSVVTPRGSTGAARKTPTTSPPAPGGPARDSAATKQSFCTGCGTALPSSPQKFCGHCGMKL